MPTLTGKQVGPIGYGLMGFTWRPDPQPFEKSFEAMRESLKQGCNFWNGGEFYGQAPKNSIHLLKAYFDKYPEDAEKVVLSIKGAANPATIQPTGDEEGVTKCIEESLRVLDGVKKIDIYEPARVDPKVPIEDTVRTIAKFVKAGKIGGVGLSEVSANTIRRAHKVHPIAAVEIEFSLYNTDPLHNDVAKTCGELGIPIVGYSPLGRGFLTGQVKTPEDAYQLNPAMRHFPRFQPENFDTNIKLADEVIALAQRKSVKPTQVAVAWARAYSGRNGLPDIIPIPGATSIARVQENSKDVTLTPDELSQIDEILAKCEVKGQRYPEQHMHLAHA